MDDAIVLLSKNPDELFQALAPGRRRAASTVESLEQVRGNGLIVLLADDDCLGPEPVAALERVRTRFPRTRFILVDRTRNPERALRLALLAAVLPSPVDPDRLESAVRQALALGAMAVKLDAIRRGQDSSSPSEKTSGHKPR